MHKIRTVKQRDQYVSIVTVTEMINGRLSGLLKKSNQKYPNRVQQYHYLQEMLKDVAKLQVLPFDEPAYREFEKIPATVRCGVNDKEIAGIALANNFRLVTANVRHFEACR
jgi:predicted nucleic acid-binding protein